jgi:hypothetical protein
MSSAPQAGDAVPEGVLQELIQAIEAEKRLFPKRLLEIALAYARQHLDMENPTLASLWDYILGRLREAGPWRYAVLDDFPDRFGYALRNADGRGLYVKLRFDDDSRAVVMSFHD